VDQFAGIRLLGHLNFIEFLVPVSPAYVYHRIGDSLKMSATEENQPQTEAGAV